MWFDGGAGDSKRATARGAAGFEPTFCGMSAGGDELFWHWVSDTRCQFGGDNLGVAVEEQNGQRPGDVPEPPMDSKRTTTRGDDSEQDLQRAG